MVDVERWLSYKGTCHVILLAKLHDMYLYKTDNFIHNNRLEGGSLTQVLLYPKFLSKYGGKKLGCKNTRVKKKNKTFLHKNNHCKNQRNCTDKTVMST